MTEGSAPAPRHFHVRLASGQEFGPATLDLLCQWTREGRVPRDATVAPTDGGHPLAVLAIPELAAILGAPPTAPTFAPKPVEQTDATGGLIPYKNMPALAGYYVAVFSLIPCASLLLGPLAVVLGVVGLRRAREQPIARGRVHAWVAIVLGALTLAGNVVAIGVLLANA